MLKSVVGKVTWMARAITTVVGLAIMGALVLGVASTALGANGDFLKLGTAKNVATKATALVGKVATGSSLVVKNPKGGSALGLEVNVGQAPLTVNAEAGKATNLDADKLDGKNDTDFYAAGSKVADSDKLDGKDSNDFAPKAVEAWREVGATSQPEFENGWTNYGSTYSTAAFYKDPGGVVHLKGVVKGGTVATHNAGTVFWLPCGYGPNLDEVHSVLSNDAVGRVTIFWSHLGGCATAERSARVIAWPPSNNAWVSLDGITFRAAGS